jgi:hypothetical protein
MGYTIDTHGEIQNASGWDAALPLGAGAYLASADDLTKYIADLFSDAVAPPIHRMMFHKVSLPDGTIVGYLPAALVESDFYGHQKFAHAGGIWGFHAVVAYYPHDKFAIAVMVNTDNAVATEDAPVGSLERKVSRIVFGIPQPKIVDLPLSAAEAQRYLGTYVLPEFLDRGDAVRLSYSKNTLFMTQGPRPTSYINWQNAEKGIEHQSQTAIQLLYQGNGRFVEKDNDEAEVNFVGGRSGHLNVQLGFMGWPLLGEFAGPGTDK